MDYDQLIAVIDSYGEDKIAGIIFDNSARKFFTTSKPFTKAEYINATTKCMEFEEVDVKGNRYKTIKPAVCVQSIITVEEAIDKDYIDHRYLG